MHHDTAAGFRPVPASPALSGARPALAARLRSSGELRPESDPALAGGLRAWLEDELAEPGALGGADDPAMTRVVDEPALAMPAGAVGAGSTMPTRWSHGAIELMMVRAVFRLVVTGGPVGDPFDAAVAALSVGPHGPYVNRALGDMDRRRRNVLRQGVNRHGLRICADWAAVPGAWLPRTADRIAVPLAGGRVVLSATADLALGAPAADRASVCLLDVQAEASAPRHRAIRAHLALAETLRSGTAPFRVASYHATTGELAVDDVTETLLTAALRAVVRVVRGGPVASAPAVPQLPAPDAPVRAA